MEFTSHAQQRAFERFGVLLLARDFQRALKAIKRGRAQHIETTKTGKVLYNYPVGDNNGVWVLNKSQTRVITILRTHMRPDNDKPDRRKCPCCEKLSMIACYKGCSDIGWCICQDCDYSIPLEDRSQN